MIGGILLTILIGFIAGLIARAVVPGKQDLGLVRRARPAHDRGRCDRHGRSLARRRAPDAAGRGVGAPRPRVALGHPAPRPPGTSRATPPPLAEVQVMSPPSGG